MTSRTRSARRRFLRDIGVLSAAGLASSFETLPLIAPASANVAPAGDYKALVCVFLYGGNDGNNTLVPIDGRGYEQYAAARPATSGLRIARSSLLAIDPRNSATAYGLHPNLVELQRLFAKEKLAILANVGTLLRPTTRSQYIAGMRPQSLYSHSDQQAQWQSAICDAPALSGWGARVADQVARRNGGEGFPVVTSLDGTVLFASGSAPPLVVPIAGSIALARFRENTNPLPEHATLMSSQALEATQRASSSALNVSERAVDLPSLVNPILTSAHSAVAPMFAGQTTSIGRQLCQVARLIEGRRATGAQRQVFFVQTGSFDTHEAQPERQGRLFADLDLALKTFYDATVALGVSKGVTTFTLSEFGRTLAPASSGDGTAHGWGSHHFILGDGVKGGDIYGEYPELVAGGPNDAETSGRWIPTTSLDQYGATLAKWFGVDLARMPFVFPNLARFSSADLGFMA